MKLLSAKFQANVQFLKPCRALGNGRNDGRVKNWLKGKGELFLKSAVTVKNSTQSWKAVTDEDVNKKQREREEEWKTDCLAICHIALQVGFFIEKF